MPFHRFQRKKGECGSRRPCFYSFQSKTFLEDTSRYLKMWSQKGKLLRTPLQWQRPEASMQTQRTLCFNSSSTFMSLPDFSVWPTSGSSVMPSCDCVYKTTMCLSVCSAVCPTNHSPSTSSSRSPSSSNSWSSPRFCLSWSPEDVSSFFFSASSSWESMVKTVTSDTTSINGIASWKIEETRHGKDRRDLHTFLSPFSCLFALRCSFGIGSLVAKSKMKTHLLLTRFCCKDVYRVFHRLSFHDWKVIKKECSNLTPPLLPKSWCALLLTDFSESFFESITLDSCSLACFRSVSHLFTVA